MLSSKSLLAVLSMSVLLTACFGGGGGGSGSSGSRSGRLGSHQAQFVDAPTQGLQYYQDGEQSDYRTTEANGVFYCNPGSTVTFSLRSGYTDLGSVTCGADVVFPKDLSSDTEVPKYIALLLHTLDARFDGEDYSFSAGANGTIVIAQSNVNLLAEADLDFDPSDVNSIMGTINEIRSIRCLKQYVHWPLNSGEDRGALETQCKIDNTEWRTLANVELAQVISDMDTHLTNSENIFGGGSDDGDDETPETIENHSAATEQELKDYITSNGSNVNTYTYENDPSSGLQYVSKCLNINDSGDNAYALLIGGTKYAHQDAINSFEVCVITESYHVLVEVGSMASMATLETDNAGKFFKKANGDVRFAQNCPSSDATHAALINGVCSQEAVNP